MTAMRISRRGRRLRCFLALSALPLLNGCIGVAIVAPALAGIGYIVTRDNPVRAATPRPEPTVLIHNDALAPAPGVTLTNLTELPPPSGLQVMTFTDPGWQQFLAYARDRAAALAGDGPAESALLATQGAVSLRPDRRPCPERLPAILIDLDRGNEAFSGAAGGNAPTSLAAELASLREAGIIVMWISRSPADKVREIGDALLQAGLDPTGRDPLLLIRHGEQRKQTLREEANQDVCIVAIAGDERADFDELFGYLRGPQDATMLEPMLGAGWFLVPPLLAPEAPATPAP